MAGRDVMRWTSVAALALAAANGAVAAEPQAAVPERFRGTWTSDAGRCNARNDDMRLAIAADRVTFYESVGPIRAVVTQGDELALIAEMTGEGETWLDVRRFKLSADRKTLTDETIDPPVARHRCPARDR